MKVKVDCSRLIDRQSRPAEELVDLPEGSTVGSLLSTLGFPEQQASFLVVMRDGYRCQKHTRLSDGDQVEIAVPLGGG